MDVKSYKEFYRDYYGKEPTEKLIETFCQINGVQMSQSKVEMKEEIQPQQQEIRIRTLFDLLKPE